MVAERLPHYIRPTGLTRLPRHHLVIDTEASVSDITGGDSQSWRLGCGEHFTGYAGREWSDPEPRFYAHPWELWADVNYLAPASHRLVVWAHNLSYDLRVSAALPHLVAMGWRLDGIALDKTCSWARFEQDNRSILLCDLFSWLPASLAQVAGDLGLDPSPRLPLAAADDAWRKRCARDVAITRTAVIELLDTVSEEDLGPWRPTGPGQSHSAWRRRFIGCKTLVHDRVDVLDLERAGAWTGRAEAWRWGVQDHGPYTEYDLDLAYCQIAADCELPAVLAGALPVHSLDDLLKAAEQYAVLARVRVRTAREVVPCHHAEHIVWPIGDFETTLWDPELRLLAQAGAEVQVIAAYRYRRGPVLQDMARWIIDQLALGAGELPAVRRRMLKHWARALIGRCALRYREWELWGESEVSDVSLGLMEFKADGRVCEIMQVGTERRILSEQRESPESLPQVPGWVMSECRRRLWDLIEAAGPREVVYMDTDSLIVTELGRRRIERRRRGGELPAMKVKGRYGRLEIWGPRMLEVDGSRRMAGVPLQARLDQGGRLSGEVFIGLKESLMRREIDTVSVLRRSYDPAAPDRRRIHLPAGATQPLSLPVRDE